MTSANRIEITVSDELLAAIDNARQHEPRASFIKRACEQALTVSAPAKLRDATRVLGSVGEADGPLGRGEQLRGAGVSLPPVRRDVGPKPEAASKPIPKTGKSKR